MTGPTPGTTYYFRAAGGKSSGRTRGTSELHSRCGSVARDLAATSIGATTASRTGTSIRTVRMNARFEYGRIGAFHIHQHVVRSGRQWHRRHGVRRRVDGVNHPNHLLRPCRRRQQFRDHPREILSFTPARPVAYHGCRDRFGATTATLNGTVNLNRPRNARSEMMNAGTFPCTPHVVRTDRLRRRRRGDRPPRQGLDDPQERTTSVSPQQQFRGRCGDI